LSELAFVAFVALGRADFFPRVPSLVGCKPVACLNWASLFLSYCSISCRDKPVILVETAMVESTPSWGAERALSWLSDTSEPDNMVLRPTSMDWLASTPMDEWLDIETALGAGPALKEANCSAPAESIRFILAHCCSPLRLVHSLGEMGPKFEKLLTGSFVAGTVFELMAEVDGLRLAGPWPWPCDVLACSRSMNRVPPKGPVCLLSLGEPPWATCCRFDAVAAWP